MVKAAQQLHKPLKGVQALSLVWLEAVKPYFPDKAPMKLTGKQIGQLKIFHDACPPGMRTAILKRVVAEWTKFTNRVEQDTGYAHAPYTPTLGFLAQYAHIAADFGMPSKAVFGTPPAHEEIPVQVVAQAAKPVVQKDATDEDYEYVPAPPPEHGMTKEQLMVKPDPTKSKFKDEDFG
jgi:hypothetical protein